MKEVNIISTVVQRDQSGKRVPTGNNIYIQGDLSDYLLKTVWDSVFEVRTDSNGVKYLFGKLPLVTQYGITMYSGEGVNVESIYAGIPFDNKTIWLNPETQQVEVLVSGGSGEGNGTSNFWELSNIPSWITATKPVYSYSEITDTPDLSVYALKTEIPSLSGYATQSWVEGKGYALQTSLDATNTELAKKWTQDDTKIANWDSAFGWGNHADAGYAKKTYVDSTFVTISGSEDVTGIHNFTNGLKIGGLSLSKSQDDVVYLDANLVVRGGITMYGTNSTTAPSIMEGLLYDDTTLGINSDGELYVKGGTSGGLDTTELQNYLTSNSYLNVTEGDGRYLKLSNSGDILISNTAKGVINFSSSHADETGIRLYYNNTNKGGLWYSSDTMYQRGIHLYHKDSETSLGINNEGYPYYYVNGGERILLHSGNYSSYALPLSGGKMAGGIDSPGNQYYESDRKYAIDLNNSDIIGANAIYFNDSANNAAEGLIFLRTNDDNYDTLNVLDGEIYLNVNRTPLASGETAPLTTSGYKVWHSGNSAPTDANRLISIYGTASSGSMDDRPTSANVYWTDKSIRYFLATSSMTEGKPDADSRIIHLAWDNTGWNAQLAIPGYNAGNIQWRAQGLNSDGKSWGNWITVLDSRNYSNYALPLTGGVMTGTIIVGDYTSFGVNNNVFYLGSPDYPVDIRSNGKTTINNNTIWHSGNDGAGSGLDADLLDGQEGSWYQNNVISFKRRGSTGTSEFDANIGVDAMMYNYSSTSYWKNAPSRMLYGQIFTLHSGDTYALSGQLAWDISHNSTTDTTRGLWWRATDDGTWTEAQWHQIAFTDSNVASATILKTARTIWGQSFDGSGDVSGAITNATSGSFSSNIIATGGITAGGTTSNNSTYKLYVAGHGYILQNFHVNGNVGIGTTSPSYKLHVAGLITSSNSNAEAGLNANGSTYQLFFGVGLGNTNRGIYDRTNSSWWMYRDGTLNTLFPQGNFGIGTTSPSYKLHVVGNTYLNGDVYVDTLNTYDILPRSTESYSCGYSGKRWYQVYSYIGNFSGAMTLGSTLSVTGATTMTNVTITGDLRLKDSTNYGRTIYFGDGAYCYLKEATDDVMTIYGGNGININTSSTSYKVSINTNLLVSGGITMYSARSLKNIKDESGLSLEQLSVIKPTRFTWKDGRDNRIHFGGIADDVKQVLPEVVYDSEGVLTMDYGNAAFAIASSLIKPVVDHERRIAMLEKENEELRNEVERLKSA